MQIISTAHVMVLSFRSLEFPRHLQIFRIRNQVKQLVLYFCLFSLVLPSLSKLTLHFMVHDIMFCNLHRHFHSAPSLIKCNNCIDLDFSNMAVDVSHEKGIIVFHEIFSVQFVHFAFFKFICKHINKVLLIQYVLQNSV